MSALTRCGGRAPKPAAKGAARRALLAAAALLAMVVMEEAHADGYPRLFNSSETRSDNLKPFPKWLGALRRAVLQDLNLRLDHAILVVYLDGKAFVLDNQINQVVSAERIRHYKPVFSVNEMAWWVHRS